MQIDTRVAAADRAAPEGHVTTAGYSPNAVCALDPGDRFRLLRTMQAHLVFSEQQPLSAIRNRSLHLKLALAGRCDLSL